MFWYGTIASKINVTPKCVYLPILKLHSILAVANLLPHNNISQICYCGQISLQSAAVNCSFSDNLTIMEGNIFFAGDGTNSKIVTRNMVVRDYSLWSRLQEWEVKNCSKTGKLLFSVSSVWRRLEKLWNQLLNFF